MFILSDICAICHDLFDITELNHKFLLTPVLRDDL